MYHLHLVVMFRLPTLNVRLWKTHQRSGEQGSTKKPLPRQTSAASKTGTPAQVFTFDFVAQFRPLPENMPKTESRPRGTDFPDTMFDDVSLCVGKKSKRGSSPSVSGRPLPSLAPVYFGPGGPEPTEQIDQATRSRPARPDQADS